MNHNLHRFIDAQSGIYEQAIKELRQGRKNSHWMWYIFPQIQGLGYSPTAKFFAIGSLEEAKEYLNDSILGNRLVECCQAILQLEGKTAEEIFGSIDAMKLKSSMTLFSLATENSVFDRVLEMYYDGEKDDLTQQFIC